jgi:hypothetical protein
MVPNRNLRAQGQSISRLEYYDVHRVLPGPEFWLLLSSQEKSLCG